MAAIEAKYHSMLRATIQEQLKHDPDVVTRKRKPLKKPLAFGATWELRLGPANRFRVLYKVNKADLKVFVLAIGVKRGNRLFIGSEEVSS